MSFLAPEALGLSHRDALQSHLLQRLLHLVELEWLDDGLNFFHSVSSPGSPDTSPGSAAFSDSRVRAKGGNGGKDPHFRSLAARVHILRTKRLIGMPRV